jgi:hypothetical protein
MTHPLVRIGALSLALGVTVLSTPLHAQFIVYDPSNYFEAVLEYEQLIRQYAFLLRQARRVPVDLGSRYHAYSLDWTTHDVSGALLYARRVLAALNEGDRTGSAYRNLVAPLDVPTDVVARMPRAMQRRLAAAYASLELTDSMNRLAIDQTGTGRAEGPLTLQAVKNVERDIANPGDDFHSQTALLEKINAALAIAVRLSEQTNQFEVSALEQSIVEATRKRQTEAALMNAIIRQWRYGKAYGDDLFSQTAANIDGWRPY